MVGENTGRCVFGGLGFHEMRLGALWFLHTEIGFSYVTGNPVRVWHSWRMIIYKVIMTLCTLDFDLSSVARLWLDDVV